MDPSATVQNKDRPVAVEKRRSARNRIGLTAILLCRSHGPIACVIRDFSAGGMRLSAPEDASTEDISAVQRLTRGEAVAVRFVLPAAGAAMVHEVRASVAWATAGRLGILFSGPYPEAVAALKRITGEQGSGLAPRPSTEADPLNATPSSGPRALVRAYQAIVTEVLSAAAEQCFEKIDKEWLEPSTAASAGAAETALLDAAAVLHNERSRLVAKIPAEVCRDIALLAQGKMPPQRHETGAAQPQPGTLALVEDDDLEELLARSRVVTKLETQFKTPLFRVEQRLAQLLGYRSENIKSPVSPASLCAVYAQVLQELGLKPVAVRAAYEVWEWALTERLGELYRRLDALLDKSGLAAQTANHRTVQRSGISPASSAHRIAAPLPAALHSETAQYPVVSTGPIPRIVSGIGPGGVRGIVGPMVAAQDPLSTQRWNPAAAPRTAGPPDARGAPWAQPASEVSGPLYYAAEDRARFATRPIPQVLSGTDAGGMHGIINPGRAAQNLMAWQRWSATAAPRTPGSLDAMDAVLAQPASETPGLPYYAPDDLVRAISHLQATSGQPLTGDGVIERLLDVLQGPGEAPRQITAGDRSRVELVSQFLDALMGDRLVGERARAQIGRLTPQVYQMALSDPGFLSDQGHPTRRILESLTRLHGTLPEEAVHELEAMIERVPQGGDGGNNAGPGWEGIAEVLQRIENTREENFKLNLQGVVSGYEKQQAFLQSRRKPGEMARSGQGTATSAPLAKEWLVWLERAKRLQVGDAVQMSKGSLAGQRLDVAWIGAAHNPCVLVDGEGKKVAAWTLQELAIQLRTGAASVVDAATRSPVERAFLSVLQSVFSRLCEQAVAESPEQHARGGEATPAAPMREDVAGFPPLDRAEPPADWAADIDKAIEGQALELWFQRIEPVQSVVTGGLRLRMVPRIKSGGQVLEVPEDLLGKPIDGKLQLLGRRVLREAIGWMTGSRLGPEVQLLVLGLPRVQVLDTQYLELALEALMASPVPPSKLCFEVDEATVLAVPAEVGHLVGTLRALGCRVAIGGLGRSGALGDYLSRVSADYLAIDRSFIAGMADSARDLAVVRSSQEIARALGRKTLAEGVESEDQSRMIRDIGIDYLVGPLFSSTQLIPEPE